MSGRERIQAAAREYCAASRREAAARLELASAREKTETLLGAFLARQAEIETARQNLQAAAQSLEPEPSCYPSPAPWVSARREIDEIETQSRFDAGQVLLALSDTGDWAENGWWIVQNAAMHLQGRFVSIHMVAKWWEGQRLAERRRLEALEIDSRQEAAELLRTLHDGPRDPQAKDILDHAALFLSGYRVDGSLHRSFVAKWWNLTGGARHEQVWTQYAPSRQQIDWRAAADEERRGEILARMKRWVDGIEQRSREQAVDILLGLAEKKLEYGDEGAVLVPVSYGIGWNIVENAAAHLKGKQFAGRPSLVQLWWNTMTLCADCGHPAVDHYRKQQSADWAVHLCRRCECRSLCYEVVPSC